METSQLQRDPYGNDYLSLEYEIDHLKLNEIVLQITIYKTNGLSQVISGFKINNSNKDFAVYHINESLIRNRLYFHRKFLGDGGIAFVLASVDYPKKYKAVNYSLSNSIDEAYKLFDIIPLTKKINTETVKFLDGQYFDPDLYPELYAYLGKNTLPNIPSKTFIKFSDRTNKLAVNKTKFYRIFWGHAESHYHTMHTPTYARHACQDDNDVTTNHDRRPSVSGGPYDHPVNWSRQVQESITKDHWDFDTGDACPQRIPLYYHMKIKDTSKLKDIFINPFDENYEKQTVDEYQIVEASSNANFAIIVLDNIPHPNTDILTTIDGIDILVLNDTYGYAEYPKENEAVYFQNDRNFGILYVHPKHLGKKVRIQYKAITKNFVRDNELLLDLFQVGEPFPLLHRIENNPNFMLCNGAKFNKDVYKKLYTKLGTDILPDYCAGFVASETDSSKIQKIQKYEYPQIGYMGKSPVHTHTYTIQHGGTTRDPRVPGGCGFNPRKSTLSHQYTSYNIDKKYTDSTFNIAIDHNLGVEKVDFEFSSELAPRFCGLYWYIRAL